MNLLKTAILLVLLAAPAAARENVPDSRLTPGEVATTSRALVCQSGFSAMMRHTTEIMKDATYRAYGMEKSKSTKIDHLVPLSLGGADTMKNLWPSDFRAGKYNASAKDRLELKVRELVCGGKLSVREGQALFMRDWRLAYERYCSGLDACPSYLRKAKEKLTNCPTGCR